MKYIITESQLNQAALKYLNSEYGDLKPFQSETYPNFIYYKKNNIDILEYNKKYGTFRVNYDRIWSLFEDYFSMEDEQIQKLIKLWLEEHYNLRVTEILSPFHDFK